jgi:uncharacterized membrane protein YdbT with pleckstrin-like domain
MLLKYQNLIMTIIKNIINFYIEGFRNMTVGKKLWTVIIIKLFVIYAILKLFFFHDFLNSKFKNTTEKSNYVMDQLTK